MASTKSLQTLRKSDSQFNELYSGRWDMYAASDDYTPIGLDPSPREITKVTANDKTFTEKRNRSSLEWL